MFPRASGKGRITSGKKDQLIEVTAGKAQGAFFSVERYPGFAAQVFFALITL